MSKLVEEVTEKSASATLTAAGSARWLAPELIEGSVSSQTFASDTYSFAMALLELYTGKHPFAERKREASVIQDIVVHKKTPQRPRDEAVVTLTDGIWGLMERCWQRDVSLRPHMEQVKQSLEALTTTTE
jgi:serine/threonine protein kinase